MCTTLWYDIDQEEESVASEDDLEDAVQDEEEHSDHPEDGCGQSDAYSESADMPSQGSTGARSKDPQQHDPGRLTSSVQGEQ